MQVFAQPNGYKNKQIKEKVQFSLRRDDTGMKKLCSETHFSRFVYKQNSCLIGVSLRKFDLEKFIEIKIKECKLCNSSWLR